MKNTFKRLTEILPTEVSIWDIILKKLEKINEFKRIKNELWTQENKNWLINAKSVAFVKRKCNAFSCTLQQYNKWGVRYTIQEDAKHKIVYAEVSDV